jgi:hypothetical protein
VKQQRLTITAVVVVVLSLALYVGGAKLRSMPKPIPGSSVFRSSVDYEHGMAQIMGTFYFAGGGSVRIRCWSPGVMTRTESFQIFLQYPGYSGWPRPGQKALRSVKLTAGDFHTVLATADFDFLSREQLRQIAKAHEAVFDIDKDDSMTLHEDQLAEIRALLTYTDSLPPNYEGTRMKTQLIGIALEQYAQDHDGKYPAGKSSTEIFQQLIDQQYTDDGSAFYFHMPGKTETTTKKLKPENVCFDVTNAVLPDDPASLPVVFTTGYQMDYAKGGKAHLRANGDPEGLGVYPKSGFGERVGFDRAYPQGIPVIPANFDSKGRTYVQLTPEGPVPGN